MNSLVRIILCIAELFLFTWCMLMFFPLIFFGSAGTAFISLICGCALAIDMCFRMIEGRGISW